MTNQTKRTFIIIGIPVMLLMVAGTTYIATRPTSPTESSAAGNPQNAASTIHENQHLGQGDNNSGGQSANAHGQAVNTIQNDTQLEQTQTELNAVDENALDTDANQLSSDASGL